MRVGILGRVGDDEFGHLVLSRLQESGVDTRHVMVDPSVKTGLGIALCQDGDRAILTYIGSIGALRHHDVSDALLASARHMHYGSFFLHTGLVSHAPDIFRRARALGLSTSLDTNWDPNESWDATLGDVLPLTDIFMPNEQEARLISGREDLDAAMDWVQKKGVAIVTLKRGAQGAQVYSAQKRFECIVEETTSGDSVGAGDSFDAGFLSGWLRGLSLEQCLDIACECGRSVAGAMGGLAGQPIWDDLVQHKET
jgi:sugar/nucleoside kinase (ribokinase family)